MTAPGYRKAAPAAPLPKGSGVHGAGKTLAPVHPLHPWVQAVQAVQVDFPKQLIQIIKNNSPIPAAFRVCRGLGDSRGLACASGPDFQESRGQTVKAARAGASSSLQVYQDFKIANGSNTRYPFITVEPSTSYEGCQRGCQQ